MTTDALGHALSGATAEAAAHYEHAVTAFNLYRGDPIAALERATDIAPDFVMAHLLKAHLFAVATEPAAAAAASELLGATVALQLNDRERSHRNAIELILQGEWSAAAIALDFHHTRYPFDLVALQVGHLCDFFRANARNLRDRMARTLPRWSADMPGYSILLGMYAFGLEESGHYAQAEDTGRSALDAQPLDCWAHHAVAHVMEMQARHQDGLGWMSERELHWSGDDNFFQVHNWWHRALCHLELGQAERAMALYDGPIRGGRSQVAVDMVDASALLWRLTLSGVDVGDRWLELAATWDMHADGALYPFNDWHAAMAYLGAGREHEVEKLRNAFLSAPREREASRWAADTGADLVAGFTAFWHGKHDTAIQHLYRARSIANTFGGSHAQRDIIDWTLTEAALRGRQFALAETLANERLALRPHSPVNHAFLRRAAAKASPDRVQVVAAA